MPSIDIICLANSKKYQGRCIAGLRTDGGGWVRPVAPGSNGALHPGHYILSNDTQPELLDVIRVGCIGPQPAPHQPENWLVDGTRWELLARPVPAEQGALLQTACVSGPALFGNCGDRVNYGALKLGLSPASLALVVPENPCWNIGTNARGGRQAKAGFTLCGAAYNLSVTDPVWLSRLDGLPKGRHPASAAGITDGDRVLLTVSLGEPTEWDNCCYKLVAAVLIMRHEEQLEWRIT